jgi:hypothetical protein
MCEHGHALRDEMRRDPRLKEFFWGADDWGYGPYDYDYRDGESYDGSDDRGNGPRPR